jgi:microcystin-dependent protein
MQDKNIHIDYFLQDLSDYEVPVGGSMHTSFAVPIDRATCAGSLNCEHETKQMETEKSLRALAKTLIVSLLMVAPLLSWTQVGVGTTSPHPSCMLHIAAGAGSNKGVLLPSISSGSREVLDSTQNIAHGLVFFDMDLQKFYYFHQSPKQWFELDHDWIRKDVAGASPVVGTHIYSGVPGNVGIGTLPTVNPAAKLTVVGNQSIGSASFTQDSVPPANSLIVQTWVGIGTRTRVSGRELDVRGQVGVTGTVTASEFIGEGVVPPGTITMFSGATYSSANFANTGLGNVGTPYFGWALCNGQNGTPDLRGRFVVGQRNSFGTGSPSGVPGQQYDNTSEYNNADYDLHDTGGEREPTLTVAQMPSHDHTITDPGHDHPMYIFDTFQVTDQGQCGDKIVNVDNVSCPINLFGTRTTSTSYITNATTGITSTNNRGSSNSFDNRPPYYVLAYIMKL